MDRLKLVGLANQARIRLSYAASTMKTIPLHIGEWEEVVGHVESVTIDEDRLRIILSSIPQYALIEIPVSEAKFDPPQMGMNVGILRTNDRRYLLRR